MGAKRPLESIALRVARRRYSSQASGGQSAPGGVGPSSATRYLLLAASGFAGGAAAALALNIWDDRGDDQVPPSASALNDKYGSPEDFQRAIRELRDSFDDKDAVSTDPDDLHTHGHSENDYHPGAYSLLILAPSTLQMELVGSFPSVVVFPKSTEEVVRVVKIANKYKMPIVPYSGATSLEGNFRSVCSCFHCVQIFYILNRFSL